MSEPQSKKRGGKFTIATLLIVTTVIAFHCAFPALFVALGMTLGIAIGIGFALSPFILFGIFLSPSKDAQLDVWGNPFFKYLIIVYLCCVVTIYLMLAFSTMAMSYYNIS